MNALICLEDGFTLAGKSFTGPGEAAGRFVFHTGISGYQERLSDPACAGEILCLSYPLVGNYGVNQADMESSRVRAAALVVKECCRIPSNWLAEGSLPDLLKRHGVLGVEGVDTRALALHLRDKGTLRGVVSTESANPAELAAKAGALPKTAPLVPDYRGLALHDADGSLHPMNPAGQSGPGKQPRVAVLDFGARRSLLDSLHKLGCEVILAPAGEGLEQVRDCRPQALVLSDGPGDAAELAARLPGLRDFALSLPTFGCGLGALVLGLSFGARLQTLPFGHHGHNQPARDLRNGRVHITSQHHGQTLELNGQGPLAAILANLHDASLEAFSHREKPISGALFLPEDGAAGMLHKFRGSF